ncbi:outer membrane protein assembly factor BamB family protein [Brevirhabdus sp.]|uniref:outer membrane protein assembly factor BamB family protein n=1 Tax=Brevirhabdus sp. TaxID=2004514 RepID=UPI004058E7CA
MKLKHSVGVVALLGMATVLSGCGPDEVKLTGKRFDVTAPLDASKGTESVQGEGVVDWPDAERDPRRIVSAGTVPALALPQQVTNRDWTHPNGTASHRIQHPRLSAQPRLAWVADIGNGDDRQHRITASPVVADGRIFAMDSRARVTATASNGGSLWSTSVAPRSDSSADASGGGLAYGGGRLFVTTAFGAVVALDPATGGEIWRQRLDAAATGAPAVDGKLLYVVGRDGQGWAISTDTGRVQWQLPSIPAAEVRTGGAGPAVTDRLAIFPYGSGELIGAFKQGGRQLWSINVAGGRNGRAYASVRDLTAAPVIDGSRIYAGNPSGRLVAVDADTGVRQWTAEQGAVDPVWPVGGSIFLVNDQNELVRLEAATGDVIWSRPLPLFLKERVKKRRAIFAHYGPILAGGRIWVASDDQLLRGFDPGTGALAATIALPGGAASAPVVANDTLYVVSQDGRLLAFR